MYDIFDPKDLDDDELLARIQRARHFIGVHVSEGHDSLVHSIELTLAVMEEEQEYRAKKRQEDHVADMKKRKKQMAARASRSDPKPVEDEKKEDNGTITLGHISGVDD